MIEMNLNPEPFEQIKAGTKTIEMRLFDEKRQSLKVGDVILFVNRADTKQKVKAKIKALHIYKNFEDLYSRFNKTELGYGRNEKAKAEDMQNFYTLQQQKKYGVVGIEIKRIV